MNDGKDHANVVESRYVEEGEGLEEPTGAHHHQQLAVQVKIDLHTQGVGLIKLAEALQYQQLTVQDKIYLHTHGVGKIKPAKALHRQKLAVQVKIDLHTHRVGLIKPAEAPSAVSNLLYHRTKLTYCKLCI